ncbi:MAG: nucleotidyltransferase domain-containing protein [Candidatus Peribacteraceae bacterium]|nr:nucleotidyltransferase domain-containing protein [Candidatus Peribacteraceae bacterium]MDD5739427.1 nucleotidyltransferase domain-containing protein [Candidatus Peribacteraceae bacterium]
MKYRAPSKERGLRIASRLKAKLQERGIPVVSVLLFGSLVGGAPHRWSDVDIAVVHEAFDESRMRERFIIRGERENYDVPMDIVCLHPEDLDDLSFGIAQEVRKHGVPV